jgi:uracil-DNA glycosylase
MLSQVNTDWKPILQNIMLDFPELESKIEKERKDYDGLADIYPPPSQVMTAFNLCPISNLKVVIIGQDPYHQPKQAHGLAFSVNPGIKIPPSLRNIFLEIQQNYQLSPNLPSSGDLSYLASQGVLLLNTTLTVRQSNPNSHVKIWKGFTQKIIDYITSNHKDIIFMLWGNNAKALLKKIPESLIKKNNHYILSSVHPSPLSANRGGWFGKELFLKANIKLEEYQKTTINWVSPNYSNSESD